MDGYVKQFCKSLKNCIQKSQYRTGVDKTQKFISRQSSSFQTFSRSTIIHLLYLESYCCHKIIIKTLTQPQEYIETFVVKETLEIMLRNLRVCYQCIHSYLQSKQIIVNFGRQNKTNSNQYENELYKITEKSFGQFLQIIILLMKDLLLLIGFKKQHRNKDNIYDSTIQFLNSITNVLQKKKIRFRVNQLQINCIYVVYLFRSKQYKKGTKQCQQLLVEIFDYLSHLSHKLGLSNESSSSKYRKAIKKCYKLLLMSLLYQAFFHILCDQFRPIQSLVSIIRKIQTIAGPKQLIRYYQSYNDILNILSTIAKQHQQFDYHFGKGEVLSFEAICGIIQNSERMEEQNKNQYNWGQKFNLQTTKPTFFSYNQKKAKIHFKTSNGIGPESKHSQQSNNNGMNNSKSFRSVKTEKSVKDAAIDTVFQRVDHVIEGSRQIGSSKQIIHTFEKEDNLYFETKRKTVCIKSNEGYKDVRFNKNYQNFDADHDQHYKNKLISQNQQAKKFKEYNFFSTEASKHLQNPSNNNKSMHVQFKQCRKTSNQNFSRKKGENGFCALSMMVQNNDEIHQLKINNQLIQNRKNKKYLTSVSNIVNKHIVRLTQRILDNNIKTSKLDLERKKNMARATLQIFNEYNYMDQQITKNYNKSWNKFRRKIDEEHYKKQRIITNIKQPNFLNPSIDVEDKAPQPNQYKKPIKIQHKGISMRSAHNTLNYKQKSERNVTTRNSKNARLNNQNPKNSSLKFISMIMKNSDDLTISNFRKQPQLQKFFKILIRNKSSLSISSFSSKLQSYLKKQENKRIQQIQRQKQARENSIKFGFWKQSSNNNQQRNSIKIDKTLSITMPDWNQKIKNKQNPSTTDELNKKKGILKFNKMKSCNVVLDEHEEETHKKSKSKIAFNDNNEIDVCMQEDKKNRNTTYRHRLLVQQQMQETEEHEIQFETARQNILLNSRKSSKYGIKSGFMEVRTNKHINHQATHKKLQICSESQLKCTKNNPHSFRYKSKYDKQNVKSGKIPSYMTDQEYNQKLELCYRKSLQTLEDVTRKVLLKKEQLNGSHKSKQKKKILRKSQAYFAY